VLAWDEDYKALDEAGTHLLQLKAELREGDGDVILNVEKCFELMDDNVKGARDCCC
jgi:hypothetical protein